MADKKITDLQLRSDVDEDVNFPVDDGIQSYRVTSNQVKAFALAQQIDPLSILNHSLAISLAANALTIALKTAAGANPSAASPVKMYFRDPTLTNGNSSLVSHAAALSTVISSGSTAGHFDGKDDFIYVYGMNNAGALELAWSTSGLWDEGVLHTTTAEGGAGAADSRRVLYSTTARTNKAIRFLGRFRSNQSTAGTWAAAPLEISLHCKRPTMELVQSNVVNTDDSVTSATFVTFPNSPAFSFKPIVSGVYKVYSHLPIEISTGGSARAAQVRVIDTSGSPRLLQETQGFAFCITALTLDVSTLHVCSTYYLEKGTTYVFDLQGQISGNTLVLGGAAGCPFYMFAEGPFAQ